jgi:ribokinase
VFSAAVKNEILSFLEVKTSREIQTVVMPDFFFDRFINLELDIQHFYELIIQIAQHKGGSLDGVSQTNIRGGNAINVASALAALDVNVTPIICTSDFGMQQIKYFFKNSKVDFSNVKLGNNLSVTTALEFQSGKEKINVMLRDLGDLKSFSPDQLTKKDYKIIENADYVCLFNWAGTLKFGTELAQVIFGRAKNKSKSKTYYDTADPNPNKAGIAGLITKVLKTHQLDILSLNENEAVTYASFLDESISQKINKLPFSDLALESARILACNFSARIDLHTSAFSATLTKNKEVIVPTFKIKVLRATGAGDSWNAGNILGDANGVSDEARLMLANAVATCYLSDKQGMHPTKAKLTSFIRNYA